jgi:hypothetical protein
MSFVVGGAEHNYLYKGQPVEAAMESLRQRNLPPLSGQPVVPVIGPRLTSLNPTSFPQASPPQTVIAFGGSFNSKSVVSMDGAACPTTVQKADRLTFRTPASCPAHTYNVTVKNGTGGTSSGLPLTSA